jgi:hypothetical protein
MCVCPGETRQRTHSLLQADNCHFLTTFTDACCCVITPSHTCQGHRPYLSTGVVTNPIGTTWASSSVINHFNHQRGSSVGLFTRVRKRGMSFQSQFLHSCRKMKSKQVHLLRFFMPQEIQQTLISVVCGSVIQSVVDQKSLCNG